MKFDVSQPTHTGTNIIPVAGVMYNGVFYKTVEAARQAQKEFIIKSLLKPAPETAAYWSYIHRGWEYTTGWDDAMARVARDFDKIMYALQEVG